MEFLLLIRLDAEIQRSLCLVRVPLNVEDTLSCYQQALERRPHCLLVFQRSRALLLRLLANTMPCELSTDGADADTLVQLGTHTSCLCRLCGAISPLCGPTPG